MKITDITMFPVWVGMRNQLIVKVDTDEGISGLGESGLSGRELAVMGALRHYREFLIGQDPMQRGRIWQELYRSQYFEGGRVLLAAQSAIDIALYDIVGKALGVPVYDLLGGRHRDVIPGFATAFGETGEEMLENIRLLAKNDWTVIRTAPLMPPSASGDRPADVFEPRESVAYTAEWLTAARAEFGPELTLGIDYHHRLSPAETVSFVQRMPVGTLDFLEEPIRDESPEAYEALRRHVAIPFAVGEEFASKWQFMPFLERHLTDFARVDICNIGGFTEALKVAGWAEAHYIDLMPHNPLGPICTAATLHLAAAVPNLAWVEVRQTQAEDIYRDDEHDTGDSIDVDLLFPTQPRLVGTSYPVPTAPGLGVEIDLDRVAHQTWQFWEAPHLRRRDGSVTNW